MDMEKRYQNGSAYSEDFVILDPLRFQGTDCRSNTLSLTDFPQKPVVTLQTILDLQKCF